MQETGMASVPQRALNGINKLVLCSSSEAESCRLIYILFLSTTFWHVTELGWLHGKQLCHVLPKKDTLKHRLPKGDLGRCF